MNGCCPPLPGRRWWTVPLISAASLRIAPQFTSPVAAASTKSSTRATKPTIGCAIAVPPTCTTRLPAAVTPSSPKRTARPVSSSRFPRARSCPAAPRTPARKSRSSFGTSASR
uniref:(northern house mosquito) hypothetical protein n=1 Tax=Culex pipiens TaxID=7175 RepID=A0A8D8A975_CULPI